MGVQHLLIFGFSHLPYVANLYKNNEVLRNDIENNF